MLSVQFLKDALERAVKSAAQMLLLLWIGDGAFNILEVRNWSAVAGIALGAFVLSVLTSVVSYPVSSRGTASLVGEIKYQPKTPVRVDGDGI